MCDSLYCSAEFAENAMALALADMSDVHHLGRPRCTAFFDNSLSCLQISADTSSVQHSVSCEAALCCFNVILLFCGCWIQSLR
jgi:hypothetical protein